MITFQRGIMLYNVEMTLFWDISQSRVCNEVIQYLVTSMYFVTVSGSTSVNYNLMLYSCGLSFTMMMSVLINFHIWWQMMPSNAQVCTICCSIWHRWTSFGPLSCVCYSREGWLVAAIKLPCSGIPVSTYTMEWILSKDLT